MENARLRQEIAQLQQVNHDLHIALRTTAEHGDIIETQLYETNVKLKAEIIERQRAQATLHTLLDMLARERDDLRIVVQTIMEHGDVLDAQWHQKFSEAAYLAKSDGLTQIANRRRFDEYLDYQWQQMTREQTPLSIILCDIDCFKQYNDSFGHLAGDDCLRQVAQALALAVKRPADLVARYGGEEFAAILPHTNEAGALKVATRMQAAIARLQIPHPSSQVNDQVTLSIGVACTIPSPQQPPSYLVDEADQRLYLAKKRGRNRIVYRIGVPPEHRGGESSYSPEEGAF